MLEMPARFWSEAFEGCVKCPLRRVPLADHRQPQRWHVLLASYSISLEGLSSLWWARRERQTRRKESLQAGSHCRTVPSTPALTIRLPSLL